MATATVVGFTLPELLVVVATALLVSSLATCLAMESTALFVPAFLFLFPVAVPAFPALAPNEAIGLTLVIMFFGQTSTLTGYWYRGRIDFGVARRALALTVPLAVLGRIGSYFVPSAALLLVFALLLFALAGLLYRVHVRGHPDHGEAAASPSVAFDRVDSAAFVVAGAFAGLVGFAVGELSNTVIHVRNRVPIRTAVGTATLVLYLTILSATLTNLALLFAAPAVARGVAIPWNAAAVIAPTVIVGGQVGAFLNSRLPELTLVRVLIGAYALVGSITVGRLLL